MGAAYSQIDPSKVDRVLLLGPSHHLYLRKSALSASATWGTPLGDLRVDLGEMEGLLERGRRSSNAGSSGSSGGGGEDAAPPSPPSPSSAPNPLFDILERSDDEAEHSLELHTSFIRRVLERGKVGGNSETEHAVPPLIPVMVGALSPETEAATARALLPLARDPRTLVVVSSDFCHWGSRFQFQSLGEEMSDDESDDGEGNGGGGRGAGSSSGGPKNNNKKKEKETIAEAIERLDRRGMRLIEQQDGPRFRAYLSATKNTICGRFPISLFLEVLRQLGEEEEGEGGGGGGGGSKSSSSALRHSVKFVAYDQSQRVVRRSESSVSYAAALVRLSRAGGRGAGAG